MAGLDDERLTSIYVSQPKAVAELSPSGGHLHLILGASRSYRSAHGESSGGIGGASSRRRSDGPSK